MRLGGCPAIAVSRSPDAFKRGANRATRGIGMAWLAEESVTRRVFHRLAGVHHHDLVGDSGDHSQIVRDQDDCHPELALQAAHQTQDLRLHGDVERGRGLVRNEQAWTQRQSHGDHRALKHPTGKLVWIVVHSALRARNPNQTEQFDRALARLLLAGGLMRADHFNDLPADPVKRMQARQWILENHSRSPARESPGFRQAAW